MDRDPTMDTSTGTARTDTTSSRSARPLVRCRATAFGLVVLAVGSTLAACSDDDTTRAATDVGAGTGPTAAPATDVDLAADAVIDPGDGGVWDPALGPADFVDRIDNPYLPLLPGSRWVYEGTTDEGVERIEVVVTDEHRVVDGITATVVRDTESLDGVLVEETFDWFAQHRDGTVWYLGEAVSDYEDGELVGHDGSWEAGVDGAQPGIVMPAHPAVGEAYRQELLPGIAEDLGEVIGVGGSAEVPAGAFVDVVTTREWNPLEPDVVEEKQYAPGVGLIAEEHVAGEAGGAELVEFTPGT
jgi:hypothetical protein